ncbi:MAG: beta-aspartyl-peptidase [Alphaproteobacteria bacterium]
MARPVLVIHGGAGNVDRAVMGDEPVAGGLSGVRQALEAGSALLQQGGSALEAVLMAVEQMESCPWLNAGTGGVLAEDWQVHCDASVMCGLTGEAGAVGDLRMIRHPIRAADAIRRNSIATLLVGRDADQFAIAEGLEQLGSNDELVTPHRLAQRKAMTAGSGPQLDHEAGGTVGAVALDAEGRLAAATSTGGMTGKAAGRIGDSAVPGAGTWAENGVAAISTTGTGDVFLACATARAIAARMAFGAESLTLACAAELARVERQGGRGGLVAVDANGNIDMPFTTTAMFRGVWQDGQGQYGFGKEQMTPL